MPITHEDHLAELCIPETIPIAEKFTVETMLAYLQTVADTPVSIVTGEFIADSFGPGFILDTMRILRVYAPDASIFAVVNHLINTVNRKSEEDLDENMVEAIIHLKEAAVVLMEVVYLHHVYQTQGADAVREIERSWYEAKAPDLSALEF